MLEISNIKTLSFKVLSLIAGVVFKRDCKENDSIIFINGVKGDLHVLFNSLIDKVKKSVPQINFINDLKNNLANNENSDFNFITDLMEPMSKEDLLSLTK